MKQLIHKIRQKEDYHKNRIIWIVAAAAVAILLIIWAIIGNGRKTTPDENFFQSFTKDLQSSQTNSAIPLDVNAVSNTNQ